MSRSEYLPYRPTKGEAFRFYFYPISNLSWNGPPDYVGISKDGGTFNATTNSAVEITQDPLEVFTRDHYYIDLTAAEMNADIIIIFAKKGGVNWFASYLLYTSGTPNLDEGGGIAAGVNTNFSPAVMTSIVKSIEKGYSLSQTTTNENGYNYYFLTNPNNPWWLIIKEKTDFTTVGYKMKNEATESDVNAWANRETHTYDASFPLA